MARIDRVRENYEDVTERLFSDKTAFEDYLKFAGKFFKLPSAQSMTIFGTNPKATMVADFDTWKKFSRYVKRGTNSIAVLDNGGLKHYFDISQTNGSKTPYQWTLGKETANALIDEVYEQSGMHFNSFSGCVNYLGSEQARETAENVMNTLNVSEENRAVFEKSYVSMTQYLIAARCELGSSFKYNGKLDLTALDMLHSKAEKERLCEFVQLAGKSVLLSLEKSINNIVMQERTVDYGRSKADMVRGGQEVLSRNQDGERQNVQARPDNVRVSGTNGTRSDGGGAGTDERADRTVGRKVAQADGGNAPRTDTVTSRAAAVGTDTTTDRPRSVGAAADAQDAVREEIPAPDGVQRVESVGEHVRSDSGQRDNGNGSAGSHRVSENDKSRSATYSTENITVNNEQTAEDISPAVSLSDIAKDILALDTAVKDSGSDVFLEDYLEKHTTNTHTFIVNMLIEQNYKPLRDYLDAVYREAYESRELLAEGTKAQNILADIQKAMKPLEKELTAVDTFKAKTVEMFSPVDGQTATDIENIVRDYVQSVLEDNNIDAEIVDLAVTGSRSRGLESGGSDIDVVIEYSSEFREDAMFNILHEEAFDISGIKVDINPIRKEETGTLGDYLENAEKTIMENHKRKTEASHSENKANSIEGKSSIHFGFLGNGLTVYDVSKWDSEIRDYPTIAHISTEGIVNYRAEKSTIAPSDIARIEAQALQLKQEFTESWNKLPYEQRLQRVLDGADALAKPDWDVFFADKNALVGEDIVKKYEHAIIFKDEQFPKAERTVTAYRVGDFYELFNEDAHTSAELLNLTETTRNGKPMTGFPAHALDDYRRNFAMQGYVLKIGDEREIKNILNPAKDVNVSAAEPSRIKDENTIFDWSKYTALGAHSAFDRIIREKNTDIDTSVKISLSPKSTDLSDYTLEIGIKPCTENNQLYFAIEYGLRNEKTEKITEVGAYFVDTDGVMIAGHSGHLPDYETFRSMVESKAAKAIDKIRENTRERSPEEIYKGMSDVDRTFFDANAYADILYIEGLVKNARANKPAEQIRLEDREKMYAEQFGTTLDEFRALIRYREAELAKQTVTVSPDDLAVGDYVRGYGAVWRITNIDGDFSIAFENTDKTDNRSVQSIIGHWKENFVKQGYEYVSPAEVQQIAAIPSEAVGENDSEEEFEEIPDEPTNDFSYGEQLSLFGEPMHEVEAPEKTIIGGIDIEEALKRELIQNGTGFVDGKFDVEQFYLEHKGDTKGFAKFLSDAYGVGGHSGEGKIKGVDYNMFGVRGIVMRIALDSGEETRVSWNWKKVANRIATLIDKQEYITQRDIDERINRYQREYSLGAEKSHYYEKAKSVLEHYGLLPEQTKTTLVTDAQELEKGDKIRYDGREWTVGGIGEHFISLKNSEGEQRNFYNAPDVKWHDTLNANGFEFISASEEKMTDLDRAKELINDFCEREYNGAGDFSDLTRVDIAYTEDEETGLPIQIYADLESFRIITQYNNVTVKVDEYTSLAEMNEIALPELNFEELILDAVTYKEPDLSVTQEYIFNNERSLAATKDFALSTGATVSDISPKSLKNGLYGIKVETWDSRADEIKDFAAAQNAVQTREWGVYQVVTFNYESGTDEKYDYRSLSEAVEAANGYVKGTKQETYGEFIKYDGAVVFNKENLKIEHTVGEIDVRSIFSEEVLKANGIDVPDNKLKTEVEEKPVESESVPREQPNEIKAGDRFMYHGNVVAVTDDKGIYPDDIVITREEKAGGISYAVTENVNIERFIREAKRILPEKEPLEENRQTAEIANPLIKELAKTVPADTAERLYNAFEGTKMADWQSNQAKINRVKRALYDILGNEEQTESAFAVLSSGEAPKLKEVVINLSPNTVDYEREKTPEQSQDKDMTEVLNKVAKTANTKIDYTITDENLGVGGAKEKFAANIAAIETLKRIESRNLHLAADMFKAHNADPDEQIILAGYVGWGGLSQAFDPNNASWAKEYRQLKELLADEEYAAAKGSTLNAHYTTPTVINAIYKGLQNLGFEGGNILEPAMGVGNFFGAMPEELRRNSHLSGVELDSITGRIAQQLYQNADVQIKGFEKTDFSDNYFDAAVGNVPFGSYSVSDKRYNRENFFIHDYFLAKTLDKLAPGGVAALITTKGTLDKENPKVREYLARRADLIGAIRLPNTAFKANAGTEVTTDILFLQKREKMAVELPDWCYIAKDNNGVPVNQYYLDHPEMVLGTMKQGLEFSLYGNPNETACVPIEGADLKEQLAAAVANLKTNNAIRKHSEQRKAEAGIIPATADVQNFTFAEVDGKMYFRENNIMTEAADKNGNALMGKALERIRALNELRRTFRTILTAQENNCSDAQLETYQKILNAQYDTFVKKYGYINDRANYQAFSKDDDYNSLCALELVNEETHEVTKSDFFSKRTVKQFTEITRVDTPQEALFVSVDTLGKLDIPYMAKLCEKEPDEVIEALKADNLIYLNPKKADPEKPYEGWEEASEYLSGNVRVKLRAAERAAEGNPELQRNVDALTAVLPQKLEAGDITARIGVHWVDVEDYQKFLQEYAKAHFAYGEPLRRAYNGEYKIPFKGRDYSKAATEIFGTKRMNSLEIFENLLNNRDVVVKDKKIDPDGKEHYEINKKETELAQDKASKMKEAFKRWLWEEPERREKYVTRYNELFNCIVGRKYDGSHQTFPGMSPSIALKPHQLDAVARAKFGGNTLLAHCVGAGKSFEMVAATMEKKRLGLINKACVVVPKALVGQMASEWLRLYPQAKILTATEKDFDKDHRQKFIGRCCTGDYDAVIMSYEQFEKIPMSFEYRRDFIQREINTLTSGINDLITGGGRNENSGSIKDMERVKKRLEARLEKLIEDNGKTKDTSLNFEQLGFDSLVVDEAHNYKNGLVVTKMQRVAGVQTTPAQKSEDILMKTQYLNENYGERNLLFATGTPVSNSMSELYIMQRYLRPSLLAQAGLQTFDDWASTFGEVVSKAEMKPAGNGYRTKKRFAKFNNLPELMAMYKEFADMRTADMLNLPVPKIKGGKPETIVAEPNDFQKAYMKVLAERSEQVHNGSVDATKDNMLKITGEARLLGLDVRCLNPEAPNYPDSKVNLLIEKVLEIYTQTTPQKGVQAIFCDIAVHGDNEAEELSENNEQNAKNPTSEKSEDGKFSVYNYIKAELIRRGVPADEICFAGDADTVKKQNEMKAQLRSGTKRIVLSSTSKLGTGANIQNKLVALHNLDIPWKPSDLEQRLGRIVRQGNENDEVGIYNYVTKDTFDAYMMNIIVTKQKFISQLNTTTSRSCEDVDDLVLNYSEIQAMAVGDERIKEKIELDMDVSRLKMLESEHYNEQYRLDDTIADAQKLLKNLTQNIAAAKNDLAFAQENRYLPENFKVEIGGKVYTDRKEAGTAIREAAVEFMANDNGAIRQPIGTFCGFELSVGKSHGSFGGATAEIVIRHGISYTTEMDLTGDISNTTRLENLFGGGIAKKITSLEERAERTNADLQAALANKGKPFEHAEELAQKSARLEQLNLELEVGKVDEVIIADDEPEQDKPDRKEKHHGKDAPDDDHDKPSSPKKGRR